MRKKASSVNGSQGQINWLLPCYHKIKKYSLRQNCDQNAVICEQ